MEVIDRAGVGPSFGVGTDRFGLARMILTAA